MDRREFLLTVPAMLPLALPMQMWHAIPVVDPESLTRTKLDPDIELLIERGQLLIMTNTDGCFMAWSPGRPDDFIVYGDQIDVVCGTIYPKVATTGYVLTGNYNEDHTSKNLPSRFFYMANKGAAWGNEVILRVESANVGPHCVVWFAHTQHAREGSTKLRRGRKATLKATAIYDHVNSGWDSIVTVRPPRRPNALRVA